MTIPLFQQVPQLVDPAGEEPLWRYFAPAKAKSLLEHKAVYFARVDRFGDTFEGSLTDPAAELKKRLLKQLEARGVEGDLRDHLIRRSAYRNFMYGSCWNMNRSESWAMWQLYVGGSDGLAIKTTYGRLHSAIIADDTTGRLLHGLVQYLNYAEEVFNFIGPLEAWFCKRSEYSFESEFRLLYLHLPPGMFSERVRAIIETLDAEYATGIRIHPDEIDWEYPTPDGFFASSESDCSCFRVCSCSPSVSGGRSILESGDKSRGAGHPCKTLVFR